MLMVGRGGPDGGSFDSRTSSSPTHMGFKSAQDEAAWKLEKTSVASLPAYVIITLPPGCRPTKSETSYTWHSDQEARSV
jgi:hypothetical protein